MATVPKGKAIHSSGHLKKAIKYIQKDEKTNYKFYCDGINVPPDCDFAILQFEEIQKLYDKNLYNNTTKNKILAHHFSQNFSPKDNVSPELAMQIARETAEKHFGKDFQVLFSTHVDKDHIHNHFIVNSISMTGEKYHSKGDTLSAFRQTSDEICKSYGLHTLDFANHKKRKRTLTYNRWHEKQISLNWKDRIKVDIDKAIIKSESISQLFDELGNRNYECKLFTNKNGEQYFGIKDKKFKKTYFANTKNFGDGYDLKSIESKIENKDLVDVPNKQFINETVFEMKAVTINVYKQKNIQLKYKDTITTIVELITTKNVIRPIKYYKQYPYSVQNDYHVQTLSDQLRFLRSKNIDSIEKFKSAKGNLKVYYDDLTSKVNTLVKMKATHRKLLNEFETLELLQNKKELTSDEILKIKALESKLDEYDINKIKDNLKKIDENIVKVQVHFEKYGEDLKMYTEIEATLEDIENESYINKAKIKDTKNINVAKEQKVINIENEKEK